MKWRRGAGAWERARLCARTVSPRADWTYLLNRLPAVFQQMFEQNASMYLARSVGL